MRGSAPSHSLRYPETRIFYAGEKLSSNLPSKDTYIKPVFSDSTVHGWTFNGFYAPSP